jgi:hypothetical protein
MNFRGTLRVESATGNKVEFDNGGVFARSINLDLTGDGSALFIKEAAVNALAGDTIVALGNNVKLEMGGNSATCGRLLEASNVVRLTAWNKFAAPMSQGCIWGVNGVEIDLSGDESVYKFNQFNTHAQPGRVSFRSSGAKSRSSSAAAASMATRAPLTIRGPGFCLAENNVITASSQFLCL